MNVELFLKDYFPGLAKDKLLLEEIVSVVSAKEFKHGDIIIDYGAYIRFVPLVVKGLVKIMRENSEGKEVLLYYLGPGSSCAASFSCCMIQKRSEIKAICEEDSVLLAIPLDQADKWMGTYSTWRNFILDMYDQRLFDMIDSIDRLAFANLDEKLWDYLDQRARLSQTSEIHASHHDIAVDLNSSRETISRLLKKLENNGRVSLERNMIKIL